MKGRNRSISPARLPACSSTSCSFTFARSSKACTAGAPQVGRTSSITRRSSFEPLMKAGALMFSNALREMGTGSTRERTAFISALPDSLLR
jgi:hypothetical protein